MSGQYVQEQRRQQEQFRSMTWGKGEVIRFNEEEEGEEKEGGKLNPGGRKSRGKGGGGGGGMCVASVSRWIRKGGEAKVTEKYIQQSNLYEVILFVFIQLEGWKD